MNPDNYDEGCYQYQFLDLSASAGLTAKDLNDFLDNKGILAGYGDSYLKAAQKYGISEIYLAAHSALETGNGTSQLANGVPYTTETGEVVIVYNMYGIGACDSDPIGLGAKKAYEMGWFTPEAAIEGGAKWIADDYIKNGQNTLYEMRWNPENPGQHQYATDVAWAVNQCKSIEKMYSYFPSAIKVFEMPVY